MSVKYLVLVAICVVYSQSDNASQNGDRAIEARIDKMKTKLAGSVKLVRNLFLAIENLYETFVPDDYRNSDDFKVMETFMLRVINQTEKHYADIETEARVTGVVKYKQPNLYIMNLVDEGREDVVEPIKRAILASNKFENATKVMYVDLWTDATEMYLDIYRELSKIQAANPEEFFIIEDTKGWDRIHIPMPADSPPDVLNVSNEIVAVMGQLNVRMNPLRNRFNQLNITT